MGNYIERMIILRKNNQYTQSKISAYLHIAQNTYSDYEKGKVKPSVNHLIALAKLYDVDMNYMLGVSDRKKGFPQE